MGRVSEVVTSFKSVSSPPPFLFLLSIHNNNPSHGRMGKARRNSVEQEVAAAWVAPLASEP